MIITDAAARETALDVTQSFIVQAPAGSGKTELLTRRFLALLAIVKLPEDIVAISFTRKAAAEMRLRILTALQYAEQLEPNEDYKKTTWLLAKRAYERSDTLGWNLLKNPNRLRVTTIDALCLNLVGQMPVLSRTGIQPAVMENAAKMYLAAIKNLFENIEHRPAEFAESLGKILNYFHYDITHLNNLFIKMLQCREQWLPYAIHGQNDLFQERLEDSLAAIIQNKLDDLIEQLSQHPSFLETLPLFNYASVNLNQQDNGIIIDAWPDNTADALVSWQRIVEFLLTKSGDWRKRLTRNEGFPAESSYNNAAEKKLAKEYKNQFLNLIEILSNDELLRLTLSQIIDLPAPDHYQQKWEIISSLLNVLTLLAMELRLQFQTSGKTDFVEIASAAKDALGHQDDPSELLLSLDNKIQHLLIDEFQDTSKLQFELLEKLTSGWLDGDGRTLFLVGDPMQSIYRFRQAEVGLFIKAREEGLGELALNALVLTANFRSDKKIVEWINQTFRQIFPVKNDIADGAIVYSPSTVIREHQHAAGVSYHPYPDEATFQHQLLKQLNHAMQDENQEHIAILVRARRHAKMIMPWLRAANIPYQAVDIENLELKPVVYDLLALTKALIYLGDKTAWFAILRAPWCGLTLSDLLNIANIAEKRSLWECLQDLDQIPQLSADGQQRLERIIPILSHALKQRFRLPLRQWIEHTWLALDGPYCLAVRSTLTDTASYFDLLSTFQQSGESFNLAELEMQLQQAFAASPVTDNKRITIMTMHKAKGLEFDTVILPALDKAGRNDDKEMLVWMDQPRSQQHENDILLAICQPSGVENDKLYKYVRKQEKAKTLYENTRVLYVAATRAKKQLHLYFEVENAEKLGNSNHSFLNLLWPAIKPQVLPLLDSGAIFYPAPAAMMIDLSDKIVLQRLPSNWISPLESSVNWNKTPVTNNEGVDFTWKSDLERRTGIVLHRLFKLFATQRPDYWQALSPTMQQARIQLLCQLEGINSAQFNEAAIAIAMGIENILYSTRGKWLLTQLQSPTAAVEFAIENLQQDEVKQVILDATFVDENNIRWIVDYKTAQPLANENLADFLVAQQASYAVQLEKYAQLMQQTENRAIKLALFFPNINEWIEWDYS